MRWLTLTLVLALPGTLAAQDHADTISAVLDEIVLPGYATLTAETAAFAAAAEAECAPTSEPLRAAYNDAFDAWIAVSHFRFGPAETDNRGFALAFWPDSRGATPRTLSELIDGQDPVIDTAEEFATVSVAARGFYAMEFLLYDEATAAAATSDYGCALIRRVASDIAATAETIEADWLETHADLMRTAGANETYTSTEDAMRALFGALVEGLEATVDLRLGRPLGTFDRPRPRRAEVWRSGRSLRHVQIVLRDLGALAEALQPGNPEVQAALTRAQEAAAALDDPIFAGVADPGGRIRVEALQVRVADVLDAVRTEIGPALGVSAGFNSLDGD
ncbi:MAG: imelysin family protein [Pseudomonadota bacterium]